MTEAESVYEEQSTGLVLDPAPPSAWVHHPVGLKPEDYRELPPPPTLTRQFTLSPYQGWGRPTYFHQWLGSTTLSRSHGSPCDTDNHPASPPRPSTGGGERESSAPTSPALEERGREAAGGWGVYGHTATPSPHASEPTREERAARHAALLAEQKAAKQRRQQAHAARQAAAQSAKRERRLENIVRHAEEQMFEVRQIAARSRAMVEASVASGGALVSNNEQRLVANVQRAAEDAIAAIRRSIARSEAGLLAGSETSMRDIDAREQVALANIERSMRAQLAEAGFEPDAAEVQAAVAAARAARVSTQDPRSESGPLPGSIVGGGFAGALVVVGGLIDLIGGGLATTIGTLIGSAWAEESLRQGGTFTPMLHPLVVAPVLEETTLALWPGNRFLAKLGFGVLEYLGNTQRGLGTPADRVVPLVVHTVLGLLPLGWRMALHCLYNATVVSRRYREGTLEALLEKCDLRKQLAEEGERESPAPKPEPPTDGLCSEPAHLDPPHFGRAATPVLIFGGMDNLLSEGARTVSAPPTPVRRRRRGGRRKGRSKSDGDGPSDDSGEGSVVSEDDPLSGSLPATIVHRSSDPPRKLAKADASANRRKAKKGGRGDGRAPPPPGGYSAREAPVAPSEPSERGADEVETPPAPDGAQEKHVPVPRQFVLYDVSRDVIGILSGRKELLGPRPADPRDRAAKAAGFITKERVTADGAGFDKLLVRMAGHRVNDRSVNAIRGTAAQMDIECQLIPRLIYQELCLTQVHDGNAGAGAGRLPVDRLNLLGPTSTELESFVSMMSGELLNRITSAIGCSAEGTTSLVQLFEAVALRWESLSGTELPRLHRIERCLAPLSRTLGLSTDRHLRTLVWLCIACFTTRLGWHAFTLFSRACSVGPSLLRGIKTSVSAWLQMEVYKATGWISTRSMQPSLTPSVLYALGHGPSSRKKVDISIEPPTTLLAKFGSTLSHWSGRSLERLGALSATLLRRLRSGMDGSPPPSSTPWPLCR